MPKISIVIPVHNARTHLNECLDSVLEQTLEDIEIICIDDASTDGSSAILDEYAQHDPRVRVITYAQNQTASQARKDGVLSSTGRYLMFIDADDSIVPTACERLFAAMEANPVDILHFGAAITMETKLPPSRIAWMKKFVSPHRGVLNGPEILAGAFSDERLYNFSLWDKIYSADLCKRSFERVKDGSFPKAQDKYAYFILSYYAQSYRGMPDEVLYRYHFGRGGTGHNLLSMPGFERYCSMALVADAIKGFLVEEDALLAHEAVYSNVRKQLLRDCVSNWNRHVAARDRATAFDLMLEYWSSPEIIGEIAELNWDDQGHVARMVNESASLAHLPRKTRVVGTYYHRISNGGTQKIMSLLIRLWVDLGYEVVLFTDMPPSEDDYGVPDGVRRVVLPSFFEITADNYVHRARELDRTIRDYGIDVMVYHAWVSKILLWDLLVCKVAGAALVSHCHSAFSQPARNMRTYFADMPSVYHLCDAVITLSDVNRAYWKNFNDNAICVANPFPFELANVEVSELTGKNVLWLGRISDEKRPHEAIRIFERVLEEEPDAEFHMVGSSLNPEYMDGLNELLDELGIRDSVFMHGFHKDVLPFYKRASVFLMTSEFEGFPTVLSESQAAGVPCVMYELPYLTLTQAQKGFVAVELGDVDAAADAVIGLLRDPDHRRAMGRAARNNIESLAEFDFAGTWSKVLQAPSKPFTVEPVDDAARIMWETLMEHYRTGAVRRNSEIGVLKRQLAAARRATEKHVKTQNELKRIRSSWSFRIGYAISAIPRRIRKSLTSTANDSRE